MDMGFRFGLEGRDLRTKHKNRWLFAIEDVSAGEEAQVNVLPPRKGGRPSISFKEITAEHLTETIYFPGRPDWGTVELTLYDLDCHSNLVFEWLRTMYDPQTGRFDYSTPSGSLSLKRDGFLTLYDACGSAVERWIFDNCWPQKIEWGELDMDSGDILMANITLRFDRAYLVDNNTQTSGSPGIDNFNNPSQSPPPSSVSPGIDDFNRNNPFQSLNR